MRRKWNRLAAWSFGLALGIFLFSYVLYHYTLPGGWFTAQWQPVPGKPWVTLLFSVWGVMFLFSGVMSLLIGRIFCGDEKKEKEKNG